MSTKDHKSYHSSKNQQLDISMQRLLDRDPYLIPFKDILRRRSAKIAETEKPFYGVIEEICSIVSGPVSAEVIAYSV